MEVKILEQKLRKVTKGSKWKPLKVFFLLALCDLGASVFQSLPRPPEEETKQRWAFEDLSATCEPAILKLVNFAKSKTCKKPIKKELVQLCQLDQRWFWWDCEDLSPPHPTAG